MPTLEATVRVGGRDLPWPGHPWPAQVNGVVDGRLDLGWGTMSADHALPFEVASIYYAQTLKANPNLPAAHALQGLTALGRKDFAGAIPHLTKAYELLPQETNFLATRAMCHFMTNNFDQAVQDANSVLRGNPNHAGTLFIRGSSLAAKGDSRGAINDLNRALQLQPLPAGYTTRAAAHFDLGDNLRALEDLSAALQLDPQLFDAYELRGRVQQKAGDHAAAVQDFSRAVELVGTADTPASRELRMNLAWLLATSPNSQVWNGSRAVQLAKAVCEADRYQDPEMIFVLAAAHARAGNFEEAKRVAQRASLRVRGNATAEKRLREFIERFEARQPIVAAD